MQGNTRVCKCGIVGVSSNQSSKTLHDFTYLSCHIYVTHVLFFHLSSEFQEI